MLSTSLIWRVFPSKTGSADTTFTLPNGTSAHLVQKGSTMTVEGKSGSERDYELVLRSKQEPDRVRLNGPALPAYTPGPGGRAASQWWWNPSTAELHVRFHGSDFRCEVDGVTLTGYGD